MNIEDLATGFMALFAGLERAHGVYHLAKKAAKQDGIKRAGRAHTEHSAVTLAKWREHLEGKTGIGIIPIRDDHTVMWGAIDIDRYDLDLVALEKNLLALKLPLVVLRTKSGGAHLLLFLAEPIPARYIRAKLSTWAVLAGFPGVEIFPKQDEISRQGDVGNWINMPYFDHSKTDRYALWDGDPIDAEVFLKKAAGRRVTREQLDAFVLSEGPASVLAEGPPCLQHLAKDGFPRGSRNRGLFNLGVLSRFAYGDEWRDKLDDLNRLYMHPPLSTSEVVNTQKSLSRKQYFYTCTQDPIASVCSKDICRTRRYGIGTSDPDAPPVQIDRLTKIKSIPPMYIVHVEGEKFECASGDLMNQNVFRKIVMERLDRLPPLMKQSQWDALINDKMKNSMEQVEAPDDSGPEGQLMVHLENFCTSRANASRLDELLLGKPYTDPDKGRTYFRSIDLLKYLEQQHFTDYTAREVWAILKRENCGHHQFMLKGKCVTAWSIAAFKEQIEGFDIPDMPGDDL